MKTKNACGSRERERRNLRKIEERKGLYNLNRPLFICTTKLTQGRSVNDNASNILKMQSIRKDNSMKSTLNAVSGITLIALVVTIVVLLILASVSITVVFGDNGILQLAKEAGEKTNEAVQKDKQDIQNMVTDMDDIINPPVDISNIKGKVNENTKAVDKYGNKITIPAGFSIVPNGTNDVKYTYDKDESGESTEIPTVQDGIVIADSTGNEFVWVPVFDETPIYTTYNGRNVGQLYDFGKCDKKGKKFIAKDPPTKILWTETGYREPDVVPLRSETKKQYDDSSDFQKILGVQSTIEFKTQLQKEFDNLVSSVNKYKGFYIGRYETGNLQSGKENVPVVQKGNTDINNVNWYYIYQTSKNISLRNTDEKVQKSVTSSMIWGCQWDAVMNWFLKDDDTKKYVINSENKGNYEGTQGDENKIIPTGSNQSYAQKNIYDMAGNVDEWTMTANENFLRAIRGGSYTDIGYSTPASDLYRNTPGEEYDIYGSRSTLIINP